MPHRPLILALVTLLTLGAGPAFAAKEPAPLKKLAPLRAELAGTLSDDGEKAVKAADRCFVQDGSWLRAMAPEQQTDMDSMYEMMSSAVTCWQQAETKGRKAPNEELALLLPFVSARARQVETLRAYLFALQAKGVGNIVETCKRFRSAVEAAAAAVTASSGLTARFTAAEAQVLAGGLEADVAGLASTITTLYQNQNCD